MRVGRDKADTKETVVAQAPAVVGIIQAELDMERVASIRRQIPVRANGCGVRTPTYPSISAESLADQLDATDCRVRAELSTPRRSEGSHCRSSPDLLG